MARTNTFAQIQTLAGLEKARDLVADPKNINPDGQLTARETRFRQKHISEDYITRRAQILIARMK
jgi:hypothetical protein